MDFGWGGGRVDPSINIIALYYEEKRLSAGMHIFMWERIRKKRSGLNEKDDGKNRLLKRR